MTSRKITTILSLLLCLATYGAPNERFNISRFSTREGLNSPTVNVLAKDAFERLWVGTPVGLNICSNGEVKSIRSIVTEEGQESLGGVFCLACAENIYFADEHGSYDYNFDTGKTNLIKYEGQRIFANCLILDDEEIILYERLSGILYSYNIKSGRTKAVHKFSDNRDIRKILRASGSKRYILADPDNGIELLDINTHSLRKIRGGEGARINAEATGLSSDGTLWTAAHDEELTAYTEESDYSNTLDLGTMASHIPGEIITHIGELSNGKILVGTSGRGLFLLDLKNRVTTNKHSPLVINTRCALDNEGPRQLIIGTSFDGLVSFSFAAIRSINDDDADADDSSGFDAQVTLSALSDEDGTIWFGTAGSGILNYNEETGDFKHYPATAGKSISSIVPFGREMLMVISRYDDIYLFNKKTGRLTHTNLLSDDRQALAKLPDGNTLCFNDPKSNFIISLDGRIKKTDNRDRLGYVNQIIATDSYAVIATDREIKRYDYQSKIVTPVGSGFKTNSSIKTIVTDSRERVWILKADALHCFDPITGSSRLVYRPLRAGGLCSMTCDSNDKLWISTNDGFIISYDDRTGKVKYFSNEDGVDCNEFLDSYVLASPSGLIYFPKASGLVVVNPDKLDNCAKDHHKITCTAFEVSHKILDIPADGSSLKIPSDHGYININMAINSDNPLTRHNIKYFVYSDGKLLFEDYVKGMSVNLPKLAYGDYVLYTRIFERDGWSELNEMLSFTVTPPFLRSILGQVLVILLLVLVICAVFALIIARYKTVEKIKMHEQESKFREDKMRFQANIAHELRTPLSLIYNPIKDRLDRCPAGSKAHKQLQRMFDQIKKMTEMVNMILESDRRELSQSDLVIENLNINAWAEDIVEIFRERCSGKGLGIEIETDPETGEVETDRHFLEIALTNLLNNAINYSEQGTITVSTMKDNGKIFISVKDQGRGFSCNPDYLFERQFREKENDSKGYGLGLPYSRNLVNILGGTITAQSDGKTGSRFTISIPEKLPEELMHLKILSDIEEDIEDVEFDTSSLTLLMADDVPDMLDLVKEKFKGSFARILTASDGVEAFRLAKAYMPDIIISDVVMPKMTGFELCRKVKSEIETAHIPVILLTSRSNSKNQSMGYKMGADGFLPKPFDANVLKRLVNSILKGRDDIRKMYAAHVFTTISEEQTFSSADEFFIKKLNQYITENMADPDLDIDKLAENMCISRSTLFKKMSHLLGTTATKYIKGMRIEAAKELLRNTDNSINEIAQMTGFAQVTYFSTVFKQETGFAPTAFRK